MKKNVVSNLSFLFLLLFFTTNTIAQKVKTLSIVYDISYPANKPSSQVNCYNKCLVLIHGSTSLTKMFTEYGDINTSLTNDCGETNLTSLSSMPTILLKSDKDLSKKTFEKYKMPYPIISVTSDTKQILGYSCKKVKQVMTLSTETQNSYSYIYEMPNSNYCINNFAFDGGIQGIMLAQECDLSKGVVQVWTAISLTEELIDSNIFIIPANYEIMTMDEYSQMLSNDTAFLKRSRELVDDAKASDKEKKAKIRKTLFGEKWNNFAYDFILIAAQAVQQVAPTFENYNNNTPITEAYNQSAEKLNTLNNSTHSNSTTDPLSSNPSYNTNSNSLSISESSSNKGGGSYAQNLIAKREQCLQNLLVQENKEHKSLLDNWYLDNPNPQKFVMAACPDHCPKYYCNAHHKQCENYCDCAGKFRSANNEITTKYTQKRTQCEIDYNESLQNQQR